MDAGTGPGAPSPSCAGRACGDRAADAERVRVPGRWRGVCRRPGPAVAAIDRHRRPAPPGRVLIGDARGHFPDRARPLPGRTVDEFQRIVIDPRRLRARARRTAGRTSCSVNDTGGSRPVPHLEPTRRGRPAGGRAEDARIARMDLGAVDRITADAIGEPGMRTFYLQARAGDELVTVIVEKEQVELLARRCSSSRHRGRDAGSRCGRRARGRSRSRSIPAGAPAGCRSASTTRRTSSCWRSTSTSPSATTRTSRNGGRARARVDLAVGQPRADAGARTPRARRWSARGRPRCQFCGNPMDPEGHVCPATNGHRTPRA